MLTIGFHSSFLFSWKHQLPLLQKPIPIKDSMDEDSNGTIDRDEFRHDGSEGIQFNEFIVLPCLIYLLTIPLSSSLAESTVVGSPQLEGTFDAIVEAFVFLDTNGNGKLKEDMIKALNESSPWEKLPSLITRTRFNEMGWNRNGKVSFREFLFALIGSRNQRRGIKASAGKHINELGGSQN